MLITGRWLLLTLSIVVVAAGLTLWMAPEARWLALVAAVCGLVSVLVLNIFRSPVAAASEESPDISMLSPQRHREMIRGTSLYLREMRYRYSIRPCPTEVSDLPAFNAEVNTVQLGFVPVIITDNATDRQGFGYVAFVHDGRRWRGPGLPCPAGQEEALRHAARCVSPLGEDELSRG